MYETGLMLYWDKQWSAAKKWFEQAAQAGMGDAYYRLAYFHVYGLDGEAIDCQKAINYLLKRKNAASNMPIMTGPGCWLHNLTITAVMVIRR